MSVRRGLLLLGIAGAALGTGGLWSCSDPLLDARVAALGDEASGVSPGPTHRPGQPCLACHGGNGPADVQFSVAGTVYENGNDDSPPLNGGTVNVFDATQLADGGAAHSVATNTAGNFYIRQDQWSPTFPLHDISVGYPGVDPPTPMQGVVGRDGSCATCHFPPRGPDSHGHVYLVVDPADFPGGP